MIDKPRILKAISLTPGGLLVGATQILPLPPVGLILWLVYRPKKRV